MHSLKLHICRSFKSEALTDFYSAVTAEEGVSTDEFLLWLDDLFGRTRGDRPSHRLSAIGRFRKAFSFDI